MSERPRRLRSELLAASFAIALKVALSREVTALIIFLERELGLQPRVDGLEAAAVDLAGAEDLQRRGVPWRRVALVVRESVVREMPVELDHFGVARGLREDRGGRDGGDELVAAHDRAAPQPGLGNVQSVDADLVGLDRQQLERAPHREERRPQDIDAIDLRDARGGHGPGKRAGANPAGEALAHPRLEDLGIGEPADRTDGIEHDGGGEHPARERAAAGFVNPAKKRSDRARGYLVHAPSRIRGKAATRRRRARHDRTRARHAGARSARAAGRGRSSLRASSRAPGPGARGSRRPAAARARRTPPKGYWAARRRAAGPGASSGGR